MRREPPVGATFESVWALLQETAQLTQENARRQKETAQQMKETDRRLGDLGLRLGEATDYLMAPQLHKKFSAVGFNFNHFSRNHVLEDHKGQRLAEIDVFLENGEYAMAVEVKTRLTTKDVKDHVKRMEVLRGVTDEHNDKRRYMGAVAGVVVTQGVLAYALKNGFYVIVPSGETVDIAIPEGFAPRIW
jgi:hypothetical protein